MEDPTTTVKPRFIRVTLAATGLPVVYLNSMCVFSIVPDPKTNTCRIWILDSDSSYIVTETVEQIIAQL